jgi:hypothetical protein
MKLGCGSVIIGVVVLGGNGEEEKRWKDALNLKGRIASRDTRTLGTAVDMKKHCQKFIYVTVLHGP